MPYKTIKINSVKDLLKVIKENNIEDYDIRFSDVSGFIDYKLTGIDMSYSSKRALIYVELDKE